METVTFTKQELDAMTPAQLTTLLLRATEVRATAVVRRVDGSIKYDRPELAGTFGEQYFTQEKTDG